MKRSLAGCFLFSSLFCFFFCTIDLFAQVDFYSEIEEQQLVDDLLDQMSVPQIVGQMMAFGFYGDVPTDDIVSLVKDYHIGTVKLFGWNANNLYSMVSGINRLQTTAMSDPLQIPLIIATDQEGGWVRHIRGHSSITPGNLSIGATGLPYDAWQTGYYIGEELKMLGISMNFAPTVDVYLNEECFGIGPRAFSSDPVETAVLSVAYYKGLDAAGVIATAKHFPGHGNADSDSHGVLPLIDSSLEDLYNQDLVPYSFLFKEKIPAVMSGHLAFPQITEEIEPASLSYFFSTELLRDQMGFEGVLITDDLFMSGAYIEGLDYAHTALRAVMNGADMVLISQPVASQYQICSLFEENYLNNPDFKERADEAVRRILKMKLRYLKGSDAVPLYPEFSAIENLPATGATEFFLDQSARAITQVKGNAIPDFSGKTVLLSGQLGVFFSEGRARFPDADIYDFDYEPSYQWNDEARNRMVALAPYYDEIIFCLANYNSLSVLKALEPWADRITVVSTLTPVYLNEVPWVQTALAVYGMGTESFKAGFAVLKKDYQAEGILPLNFEE